MGLHSSQEHLGWVELHSRPSAQRHAYDRGATRRQLWGHDGHLHHRSDGRARARSAAALCSLLPSGRRHNSPIVGRTSVGLLACLVTGRRLTRRVREATTLAWNECKGIAEQTPHVRLGGRPPSSVRRPRRRRTTRLPVAGTGAGVRTPQPATARKANGAIVACYLGY